MWSDVEEWAVRTLKLPQATLLDEAPGDDALADEMRNLGEVQRIPRPNSLQTGDSS